jgi:lysophospholipase L1-like esterase
MAHSDPIPARPSAQPGSRGLLGSRWRRLGIAISVMLVAMTTVAFAPAHAKASGLVGVKAYYLGLGDSLAFGYQPNLNWSNGYVQQWYSNLKTHGSTSLTNYGCLGETSTTFINGGCPYAYLLHNYYLGSQLNAAVSFIKAHAGKVSPVSLDMGANDLLPDIKASTCSVSSTWETDLATLDNHLTQTILPQLVKALTNGSGARTGDLVMMNYYDPYQNICPNSVAYVQELNAHLTSDASAFGVPISDVFDQFGGATTPNSHICSYTWICSSYKDIHATSTGYGQITTTFEHTTGY